MTSLRSNCFFGIRYNISTNDKLDIGKESRLTRIQDALDLFVCNLISKDPKNENE